MQHSSAGAGPPRLDDLAIGLEATETTLLHAALGATVFAAGATSEPRFVGDDNARLGLNVLEPGWLPRLRRGVFP